MFQRLKLFIILICILFISFCLTCGNEHFVHDFTISKKQFKVAKAKAIAYTKNLSAKGKILVIKHYHNIPTKKTWLIHSTNMQRYVKNNNHILILIFTSKRCNKVNVVADCLSTRDIYCTEPDCITTKNQKGLDDFLKSFNYWLKKDNYDTVGIQMFTNLTTHRLGLGVPDDDFRKVKMDGKHHQIVVISNCSVKNEFHLGRCFRKVKMPVKTSSDICSNICKKPKQKKHVTWWHKMFG
jgi:hypothetical protein